MDRHSQEAEWTEGHREQRRVSGVWCPVVCIITFVIGGEKSIVGRREINSTQKSESLFIYKIFPEVVIPNERRPTICFSNDLMHKDTYVLKAGRHTQKSSIMKKILSSFVVWTSNVNTLSTTRKFLLLPL